MSRLKQQFSRNLKGEVMGAFRNHKIGNKWRNLQRAPRNVRVTEGKQTRYSGGKHSLLNAMNSRIQGCFYRAWRCFSKDMPELWRLWTDVIDWRWASFRTRRDSTLFFFCILHCKMMLYDDGNIQNPDAVPLQFVCIPHIRGSDCDWQQHWSRDGILTGPLEEICEIDAGLVHSLKSY